MASETEKLEIPARGTRGRRVTDVFFKLLKPVAAGQISRYRKRASAEPPRMGRVPLVLLTIMERARGENERQSSEGSRKRTGRGW